MKLKSKVSYLILNQTTLTAKVGNVPETKEAGLMTPSEASWKSSRMSELPVIQLHTYQGEIQR